MSRKAVIVFVAAALIVSGFVFRALAQSANQSSSALPPPAPAAGLPKDVYPESRFRLPLVKRDNLDEDGKKLYDRSAGPITSKNLVGLQGPTGIRLWDPKVGELSRDYNDYLRFGGGLKGSVREVAILTTARELDNQFEWLAHEPVARHEGVSDATIDAIKYRKPVTGLPAPDAVLIELGRSVFRQHKVSSPVFARALKIYGPKQLVTIVSLIGHYSETGILLETFDMQLPEGQKPPLSTP